MDTLSKERRSWNMSRIKGKDTKPELIVRSLLHSMGYRYRLHQKSLPGKPDMVFKKYRAVIFVHGCFWHRHKGCKFAYKPKSKQEFWQRKFLENEARDKKNRFKLEKLDWKVLVIWECEVENIEKLKRKVTAFLQSE
ncbi:MAG: very short patch repair endonuclease [Desulfurivibrio sp.]|nr:very short patch repair endonuclease [Desulfurivibrio sp.]